MTNSLSKIASIYCAFPSLQEAEKAADVLLNEKLIACANILPGVLSIYRWEGKVEKQSEVIGFFKTSEMNAPKAIERMKDLHPYDVPGIIHFTATANPEYVEWVNHQAEKKV